MSITIKLEFPKEFIALCKKDEVEPERVLRGFIADLCETDSLQSNPRKEGYSSNGSDERMLARQYYERVGYPYFIRIIPDAHALIFKPKLLNRRKAILPLDKILKGLYNKFQNGFYWMISKLILVFDDFFLCACMSCP